MGGWVPPVRMKARKSDGKLHLKEMGKRFFSRVSVKSKQINGFNKVTKKKRKEKNKKREMKTISMVPEKRKHKSSKRGVSTRAGNLL